MPEITEGSLAHMFLLQRRLQHRLREDDLPEFMPDRIPITVTSIVAELGEILEEVQGWKDWRKEVPSVDREHLLEEYSDLMHFVINLGLYLGFSDQDLSRKFVEKNQENHNRQDRGY